MTDPSLFTSDTARPGDAPAAAMNGSVSAAPRKPATASTPRRATAAPGAVAGGSAATAPGRRRGTEGTPYAPTTTPGANGSGATAKRGGMDGSPPASETAAADNSGSVVTGGPATATPGETAAYAASLLDALVVALRSLGGEWLEERLGLVGRCEARLAAVKSETVSELTRLVGEAGAAEAVRDRTRNSRGAAKRDVRLAGQLAELPGTAAALAAGEITPQHARMIADAAEDTAVDETALLAAAASEPTDVFGHTVRNHVNERTADEDLEARRQRQRARREVSITRRPDGMYKLFGLFDPVAGARVEVALAAAARKLRRGEDPNNRATVPQRFADALEMLVTRSAKGAKQTTTLLVIANYDLVAGQLADAQLVDGTPLSADELLRVALEAKILPALFDTEGQPLWLGREYRDANDAQRIALAARDRGCVGCCAPNSFCQPHHVRHWQHGGPTDIDNLCLLCAHCHHTEAHQHDTPVTRGPDGRFALQERPAKQPKPPERDMTTDCINRPIRC